VVKYNKKKKRLEVVVGPLDIQPYEELFITYGEDYWGSHLSKAPLEKIIEAYPQVKQYSQYRKAVNREGGETEPPRKIARKAINRISSDYAREFFIERETLMTVKVS
jgi:hypothetical protein